MWSDLCTPYASLSAHSQVLITIYWLGRKAHLDAFYSGPQLNFKAFEGLLGLALSKVSCCFRGFFYEVVLLLYLVYINPALQIQALDEGSNVYVKDSWYPEREECLRLRTSCKMENSMDGIDSLDPRALHPNSEGTFTCTSYIQSPSSQ